KTLIDAGFSDKDSIKLLNSKFFTKKYRNFTSNDIIGRLNNIAKVYALKTEIICNLIVKFPQFFTYNHERVLKEIKNMYNFTNEQAIKTIVRFPQFAGYDHERAIKDIKNKYNCTDEQLINMVLKFPSIAGLNHERVFRQLNKIGKMIGINEDRIIDEIIKTPNLAGLSFRRYVAVIDIFRHLDKELNQVSKEKKIDWWLKNFVASPYVPETKKERVSYAIKKGNYSEPKLMKLLRKDTKKLKINI
ncbi:MAG: hypothetical protein QXD23_03060, partial [Candidatus Micrarchaeaceae archaeon]